MYIDRGKEVSSAYAFLVDHLQLSEEEIAEKHEDL